MNLQRKKPPRWAALFQNENVCVSGIPSDYSILRTLRFVKGKTVLLQSSLHRTIFPAASGWVNCAA